MPSFKNHIDKYCRNRFIQDDTAEWLSYGEAYELGAKIISQVGEFKSLVFLMCGNQASTISAYLALLCTDHAVLLLDAKMNAGVVDDLIEKYQPNYVIWPEQENSVQEFPNSPRGDLFEALGLLLSTSGSTGSPKLAAFTQDNILSNAEAIASYLDIKRDDVAFAHLPLHYSFGMSVINSHVVRGARIRLTQFSVMQKEFWSSFADSAATSLSGVPFHFEMFKRLRFPYLSNPNLRYLSQAGGRLNGDLVSEISEHSSKAGVDFYVMYGQTEAGPRISYLPPEMAQKYPESIGVPIPGVSLQLCDSAGHEVSEGEIGELVCFSESSMLGYALNRTDLKLGDRLNGRLATGDLAKRNKHGLYFITGRSNRFLKIQGNRVGLDDIETKLAEQNINVVCVGEDDWLCLVTDGTTDSKIVQNFVISSFKIPPRSIDIVSLNELPRKTTGKIDYAALLNQVRPDPTND